MPISCYVSVRRAGARGYQASSGPLRSTISLSQRGGNAQERGRARGRRVSDASLRRARERKLPQFRVGSALRDHEVCRGAAVRDREAFFLAFLRDMPTMLRYGMKMSPEVGVGTTKSVTRDAAAAVASLRFFSRLHLSVFGTLWVSWIPLWRLFDRDRTGNIRLTLLGMRVQGRGT